MSLTVEQVKGRIRSLASKDNADARVLLRMYMMERFLERVSHSKYADKFIIKGGILVTSMVGVALRSTMDIDTSIRNQNLSEEDALKMVEDISKIDLHDGVTFIVKEASSIMDDMEYPGIRLAMNASLESMVVPMKIDISTGDIITPSAIQYSYKLMLEDRSIEVMAYNLETILAEKLQTVLSRGILNTRMRDYYDIHVLLSVYQDKIDQNIMKEAFHETCRKRDTVELKENGKEILDTLRNDDNLKKLWNSYQKKYEYARDCNFDEVVNDIESLLNYI
jgi:predicted nucleotidyltransferase component of viral defense system